MASFAYEGVLLFGLVMTVGLVYGVLAGQHHALTALLGLRVALFLSLGTYFVYFWSRHGQTLAMRTWRLKLVSTTGGPVGPVRAAARFLLAWLWFLPALVALEVSGLRSGVSAAATLAAGVLAYAALTWLRPDRQFWHDVACGTRLVDGSAPPRGSA